MRSVQRRFNEIKRRNPYWGSYVCFVEAIHGQGFSKRVIYRWFNRLMDKEEFDQEERVAILRALKNLQPP